MPKPAIATEPTIDAQAGAAAAVECFHCGLPVPAGAAPPALDVLGEERRFCCPGCQAVCQAIVAAGLGEYYRYRSEPAASGARQAVPEFVRQLELYDRPEIQKDFVRAGRDWREASLLLEDIRCPACLWLNEKHLRGLDGVIDVSIDDTTQRARVRWDPGRIQLSQILEAITAIGYLADPYDATRSAQLLQARRWRSAERLIFAGAAGMLVMNFSLATYFMGAPDAAGTLPLWVLIGRWTSLLVATAILAYPGQDFFVGAWRDLRNRRPGMDIPIVLGLSAAYLGSLHATVTQHGEVYFDSIAMFVFLLLLARRWELRGKLAAADRLDRLGRATPRTARRLDAAGRCDEIPAGDLVVGDRIRVLPGETVPVDGALLVGTSSFDESLLTGEASPVVRGPGEPVVAGSVNGEQTVVIRVTHALQASAISEIRRLVERGLAQRPRYALLAERAARGFVAAVLVIAGATALFWLQAEPAVWLANTIAVLIVTCPCALALATPVALAASAGRFVALGVLPLRMRALDSLALCDIVAFDKTGSLTAGQPALVAVETTGSLDRGESLGYAAALSALSEHPLARALRRITPVPRLVIEQAENVPGSGIRAMIAGQAWCLGRAEFVLDRTALDPAVRTAVERLGAEGHTVSLLSNAAGVQAVMAFSDPLRAGVKDMLAGLGQTGVSQFAILSGDTQRSVSGVGRQLGIDDRRGRLSPEDKLRWIQEKQADGHRVGMFGDGINDAPVLAAADVSVSFSDATDLANASSDFLILGDDIRCLAAARRLARRTRTNILQNLAWAAGYNVLAVPLAVAGWIPPWGAAIGMSLSSLLVVLNALRLQHGNLDQGPSQTAGRAAQQDRNEGSAEADPDLLKPRPH